MKTEEILNLDCRKEENKETIQKVLRKIKPLAKYEDEVVPQEAIERCAKVLLLKYAVRIQWINITPADNVEEMVYKVSIINDDDYKWMGNVYGVTFYEAIAKTVIKVYSMTRSNEIMTREESKNKKTNIRKASGVDSE